MKVRQDPDAIDRDAKSYMVIFTLPDGRRRVITYHIPPTAPIAWAGARRIILAKLGQQFVSYTAHVLRHSDTVDVVEYGTPKGALPAPARAA